MRVVRLIFSAAAVLFSLSATFAANQKISDLTAGTPPYDPATLMELSVPNGSGGWNSRKGQLSDVVAIRFASVTLNSGQLAHLHSTPVLMIAAPGAGKFIQPITVAIKYVYETVPFETTGAESVLQGTLGGQTVLGFGTGPTILVSTGNSLNFLTGAGTASGQFDPSTFENQALYFTAADDFAAGAVLTSSLAAGGTGYSIGDTGTINSGDFNAAYTIDTVGGSGNVLTYHLTNGGAQNVPTSAVATTVVTGGGDGAFTVNILTTAIGDGAASLIISYIVITL